MNPANSVKELEREHKKLLHAMRLPDSVLTMESRNTYKHFDLAFARELIGTDQPWGVEDVFDAKNRIVTDVFLAADEGRQLYYASENDLLRKVMETATDQEHKGPFDIYESLFPVRVRGKVIHLIRTGKYRIAPFQEKDLNELAFLCGVPLKTVREAVAVLPIYTPEQVDDLKLTHARWRDSVKLAFREHIRAMELTAQQLQQERLSSLGSLAEGMAHHFSNLLSIILGYSSLLLDRAGIKKDDAEAIHKITEAAQRGRRFTEEILALSESFSDEEPSVGSLHERLQGAITLLQTRLRSGIQVQMKLDAGHDRIVAPPGIIHHIAFNAIANAVDSMPHGGTLAISTENISREENGQTRDFLRLTVVDSGILPLKKAHAPTADDTNAEERLAPKMASLLGLVASLDGTASMSTNKDQSTTLEVTLPTATDADEAAPQKRIRRRLAPSRIWVADDDPVVREMCRRVLSEEEHDVEEVGSGNEFMSRFTTEDEIPELLIYDFGMPDITGQEVCRWLREHGHRTPVILISGYSAEHPEIKKTLKLRKTFLLQKPFSFRDMSDLVTIALGETLIEEVPVS
ncbi:MAG TPA: response regulator [Kiritimatiellia bacterium]|nr:response regulator [Kiritimatiellia bacterium]HMP00755.1 response regulator [Kiritimatiellia bacterium]HMP98034.1 response regulator [Kiritimatiellia bacterium]